MYMPKNTQRPSAAGSDVQHRLGFRCQTDFLQIRNGGFGPQCGLCTVSLFLQRFRWFAAYLMDQLCGGQYYTDLNANAFLSAHTSLFVARLSWIVADQY